MTLRSLWTVLLSSAVAAAAPPAVEQVVPVAGQRGTGFTVSLAGAKLQDPQELLLYTPGVTCTQLESKSESEILARFKAAPDCALGLHAFRLRTKTGLSELRTFHITAFPVVAEADGENDDPAQAQPVKLNCSVAGTIDSADVDSYSVELKAGQRLSAEVEGIRLGVSVTDTALTILGPDGKVLASVDDTPLFRQDPFASIIAPQDGRYVVQVRDTTYGGGDNNRYLLHIGSFPRPEAVFPAGGPAGQVVSVRYLGHAAPREAKLTLPPAGQPYALYPSDAGGTAPTPNPFRVSPYPNVLEVEPNDEPKSAPPAVAWPVAFNGIISKPDDLDHYRFAAKKGDAIDVQAFGYRIGSPIDTLISVLTADGELIASNDDDETHDSRLDLLIPADGEYVLRVQDKRKQGGPNFIYRIELAPPRTGLTVFLPERVRKSQSRQVIEIPRGNRVTAHLAVRRDGVSGAVALSAGALPEGVKLSHAVISEGEYLAPIVLEAATDAPLGAQQVPIAALPLDRNVRVQGSFQQEIVLLRGPGDSSLCTTTLDKLTVAVVEPSPLKVQILPTTVPLSADGTLDVTVRIQREASFQEAVEITFPSLPPGVEVPTSVVIPADKSEAVVTLVASQNATMGEWPLIAEASPARPGRAGRDPLAVGNNGLGTPVPGMGRRPRRSSEGFLPISSQRQPISLVSSPIQGQMKTVLCEQGQSAKIVFTLESKEPLPTSFRAHLEGLPPRAKAADVTVGTEAREVSFTVAVDPTTPVGEHSALVCELTGTIQGQKVVYRIGRGGVLKVEPAGAIRRGKDGQPLTPLEALRQQGKK